MEFFYFAHCKKACRRRPRHTHTGTYDARRKPFRRCIAGRIRAFRITSVGECSNLTCPVFAMRRLILWYMGSAHCARYSVTLATAPPISSRALLFIQLPCELAFLRTSCLGPSPTCRVYVDVVAESLCLTLASAAPAIAPANGLDPSPPSQRASCSIGASTTSAGRLATATRHRDGDRSAAKSWRPSRLPPSWSWSWASYRGPPFRPMPSAWMRVIRAELGAGDGGRVAYGV